MRNKWFERKNYQKYKGNPENKKEISENKKQINQQRSFRFKISKWKIWQLDCRGPNRTYCDAFSLISFEPFQTKCIYFG